MIDGKREGGARPCSSGPSACELGEFCLDGNIFHSNFGIFVVCLCKVARGDFMCCVSVS